MSIDNTGEAAIKQQLDVELAQELPFPMEEEEDRVVAYVKEHNFVRVALQFPDRLLPFAGRVCHSLERRLKSDHSEHSRCFVLGDTSFGSCCVDVGAARHFDAACIIHYGAACLTRVEEMPVLYVFDRVALNVDALRSAMAPESAHVVMYSTSFVHQVDQARQQLSPLLQWTTLGSEMLGRANTAGYEERGVLFLAENARDPLLTLLAMQLFGSECPIYAWINDEAKYLDMRDAHAAALNKRFMKRFLLVEKARVADSIGILVSMLSNKDAVDTMQRLKGVVREAGKKPYLLVVGKINEAKLLNWPHLEVYCLLSCPFTALEITDATDARAKGMTTSYRSVITPYELLIACDQGTEWTARWYTELTDVARCQQEGERATRSVSDEPRFSSLTGSYVESSGSSSRALINATTRGEIIETILEMSPAVRYLEKEATWKGVDPRAPAEAAIVEAGRSGVASSYTGEGEGAAAPSEDPPTARPVRRVEIEMEPTPLTPSPSGSEDESAEVEALF